MNEFRWDRSRTPPNSARRQDEPRAGSDASTTRGERAPGLASASGERRAGDSVSPRTRGSNASGERANARDDDVWRRRPLARLSRFRQFTMTHASCQSLDALYPRFRARASAPRLVTPGPRARASSRVHARHGGLDLDGVLRLRGGAMRVRRATSVALEPRARREHERDREEEENNKKRIPRRRRRRRRARLVSSPPPGGARRRRREQGRVRRGRGE